ncbi:hypothetical protein AM499_02005 [Bacillus sp. FJAT-22090]|uniref:hypothetical protein n=1 Tax=Bacillus sp. FJAT-22090 TaxID=1581038 RepID=UPI0006AF8E90|nr:hypothetical protein [Bacillus sp. FJAT-22090]ALC84719.1 hypothetical protein AM499_02005 [Bacillus sp. FJAT-22090]
MEKLPNMKIFLKKLKKDKTLVFNYEKLSLFERELFLSSQNLLIENYGIRLWGISRYHYKKFIKEMEEQNLRLDSNIKKLVELSLEINNIVNNRSGNLGYGGTSTRENKKNAKLDLLIEYIGDYIQLYEEIV